VAAPRLLSCAPRRNRSHLAYLTRQAARSLRCARAALGLVGIQQRSDGREMKAEGTLRQGRGSEARMHTHANAQVRYSIIGAQGGPRKRQSAV
jgi:hypothetical protein